MHEAGAKDNRGIQMTYGLHDLVGNIGVALILLAYLMLLTGRIEAPSIRYSVVNAVGAGLIVASLTVDFNLSAFIVEAAWATISLYGIARALRARRISSSPPTQ